MGFGSGHVSGRAWVFTILLVVSVIPFWFFTVRPVNGPVGVDAGVAPVTPYTSVLRDPSGSLGIEDVRSARFAETDSFLNFGFTDDVIWLRMDIPKTFDTGDQWIIQLGIPYFDRIDAYQFIDGNLIHHRKGRGVSLQTEPYPHRDSLIPVMFPDEGAATVFLRLRSRDGTGVNARLITEELLGRQDARTRFFFGAYFGVMISMAVYNLFIFVSLRDRRYLAYVVFTLAVALNVATHYELMHELLFEGSRWLNARLNLLMFCFAVMASIGFVRSFLATRSGMPIIDRLLQGFYAAIIGVGVYALVVPHPGSKPLFVLLLPLLGVIAAAGVRALKMRNDPASRYFLVAFGVFIIGVGMFSLRRFGLLAPDPLVNYTFMAGSMIETMLLSFALAEQINMLRTQKEETQNLLISRIREHNQSLEQMKNDLERTVQVRTVKLRSSLQEKDVLLKEVHHRVKNNLSVIVSLLGFQILRESEGGRISEALLAGRSRVQSMALVHELLCSSEQVTDIDSREYFGRLMQNLQDSYAGDAVVVVDQDIDDILLPMDTLVACGLIATELVTNAMKHAFAPGGHGHILLRVKRDGEDVMLVVEDDGRGMPDDESENLGMKLVRLMVEQLEGSLDETAESGSRWVIRFAPTQGG